MLGQGIVCASRAINHHKGKWRIHNVVGEKENIIFHTNVIIKMMDFFSFQTMIFQRLFLFSLAFLPPGTDSYLRNWNCTFGVSMADLYHRKHWILVVWTIAFELGFNQPVNYAAAFLSTFALVEYLMKYYNWHNHVGGDIISHNNWS